MNDEYIITQKERNYIETLYLYINLEDVSTHTDLDMPSRYFDVISNITETLLFTGVFLGLAAGRMWYRFPNYRLGIMDYDKSKKTKQFNCLIQYEQSHLWELDQNLNCLDLPFDVSLKNYHIKRIDITKIAKHKENYIKNYGYLSPYREYAYFQGTIYLGNRRNGNVFRLYDKTKELLTNTQDHPINYKKIDFLSSYFGDIEDLYTYELELHRKYLKGSLGIETLNQLHLVYDAYKNIIGKIRFYKDTDKHKKLIAQGHQNRVTAKRLTEYAPFNRVEKKIYKPSLEYAVDRIIDISDKYIDSSGLKRTDEEYMKIFTLLSKGLNIDGKELTVTLKDTSDVNKMVQIRTKHNRMRENQGNALKIEAQRHFDCL